MSTGTQPFEIHIPQESLDDLRDRLRRTRFAEDFSNDDWSFGVPGGYLHALVDHWLSEFDWRAQEAAMNRFAHYGVDVDGVPIHFVHEPGRGPAPMPLILTHGWPWTFWDYEQLIGPLSDPAAFGADAGDAFDVIIPSLPGTAFSSPLRTTGIGVVATAELWLRLMRDVLGYDRFAAGGGDSGAFVSARLGHAHPEHLIGIRLNFPATATRGPRDDPCRGLLARRAAVAGRLSAPRSGHDRAHGRPRGRPPDAGLGDERLARGAGGLDVGAAPELERLRR